MGALPRNQITFKMDEITYLDRKTLFLDRMMLSLFEKLRYDGRAAIHEKRRAFDPPGLAARMAADQDRFPGFAGREDLIERWLRSDLLDIMTKGKRGREALVGPRPFHLNAYKATNKVTANDYGASAQVWAMLYHADRPLLTALRDFFGQGLDLATDRYDGRTELDLETLAILGIVDGIRVQPSAGAAPVPIIPLCRAQGAILADDLRCILAYSGTIPRLVLAGYVRTIIGLHLTLYQLRLFRLLPAWIAAAERGSTPDVCPAEADLENALACPAMLAITLDTTDQVSTAAGRLARVSAQAQLAGIPEYVRAVLLLNRLKEYAVTQASLGQLPPARTVPDLLRLLHAQPPQMEGWFQARIGAAIAGDDPDEVRSPVETELLRLPMSALRKYVELICLQRMRQERSQLVRLVDSLAQKNREGGLLRQNPGTGAPRWFTLDSHLLEALVQIALVDRSGEVPVTRPVLLRDFLTWLRGRYGIEIYAPAYRPVPPEEHEGWRQNQAGFRERLHEIGFFSDLSDAFNSQTLRPRYHLGPDA